VAQSELRSGGEFNILQCDLILANGQLNNLRSAVVGLTIFENIDQFSITGIITIQDSYNLASYGPIIGQEYLRLKIATPNLTGGENTIDYSSNPLLITAVNNREEIGNGVQATTMSFCSREFVINQRTRVRRTLVGSYSDIVRTMVETDLDSDKELYSEPSADKKKIIAPNVKPFDVISIATKNAVSEKFNQSTYFFWESTSGFNFRSLGDMYSQTPKMKYESTLAGTRTENGVKDIISELGAIEAYTITSSPDTVFNYATGIFSSELIVHDIISKSYQKHIYNYSDNFSEEQHLGTNPLAVNDPDGINVSSFPSKQYLKSTVGVGTDQSFNDEFYQYAYGTNKLELMQARNSQLSMMESGLQMSINVVGTTVVKAGDIVEIIIPSISAYKTTKNETEDMLYNGNFLIRSLRHDFDISNSKHTMSMNVTKDAIGKIT
jgi:hypothetical protein